MTRGALALFLSAKSNPLLEARCRLTQRLRNEPRVSSIKGFLLRINHRCEASLAPTSPLPLSLSLCTLNTYSHCWAQEEKKHYGNLFICCKYIGYYFWSRQACVIVREIVAWIFVGVISTRSFIIRAKTPFCSSFSFTAAVSLESRWNSLWLHQRRIYPQFWPSAHSFMSNTVPKVSSVRL